jgi:hypothetical protein
LRCRRFRASSKKHVTVVGSLLNEMQAIGWRFCFRSHQCLVLRLELADASLGDRLGAVCEVRAVTRFRRRLLGSYVLYPLWCSSVFV